jgi:transcriptional regulator with XRE-family HTH domain
MDMGTRIRDARIAKKLTQEELAKMIGVTKGSIAHYEKNVSTPKVELLYPLMDALDVDANYLYGVMKNPSPVMLSPREKQIIIEYRKMSVPEKKRFDMMLGLEPEELSEPKQA